MKRKLLSIFYFTIAKVGVFQLFYWLNRRKKIVLTYHNIIPDHLFDDTPQLGVSHSERIFENHIRFIKRRFDSKINERVLITFDDGYKNQCEIAAKILQKNKLSATYFVSFKLLVDGSPLIIDQVMQWVSYVPAGSYQILDNLYYITDDNRHHVGSLLYVKLLKNYPLWDVIENSLNQAYRFDALKIDSELKRLRFEPITPEDLVALKTAGHRVAAHSWDHRPLSTLPLEQQRKDFSLSKKYADQYCNSSLYSYPYGGKDEVSPETASLCAEYGFTAGYMNTPDFPGWQQVEKQFQYTRMSLPNNNDIYALDAKLSGFECFCKNAIKILKKLISRSHFNSPGLQKHERDNQ